jgi:hypothetical protein
MKAKQNKQKLDKAPKTKRIQKSKPFRKWLNSYYVNSDSHHLF